MGASCARDLQALIRDTFTRVLGQLDPTALSPCGAVLKETGVSELPDSCVMAFGRAQFRLDAPLGKLLA